MFAFKKQLILGLAALAFSFQQGFSQNLVQNGDFNANAANWVFWAPATMSECNYFETTYGGVDAANHVAEIDYGSNIRQTNIAVTPGVTYVFSLRHSMRTGASNPQTMNIKVYNGANTFLTQDIVSSNAAWLWQCKTFTFTPTTTTIDLDIKTLTPNTVTLGTIIDDVTIIAQQQTVTSSGEVCPGGTVTLTAPASVAGTTYTNYTWTGPNSFTATGTTATITNVQTAQTGIYTCTMNVNGCGTVTGTFDVQLLPKPDVTLVSNADIFICPGGSANIELANINNTNINQWFKDNAAITGATNSVLAVTTAGDYKVVVTSSGGCVDTSQTVHVTYNSVNIDYSFTIHKACSDDTVRFTNLSDAGQYFWDFGDMSTVSILKDPTHIYETQNNYTVKLKVISPEGCVDSVLKIVDVTHPLIAAFTQSADSICLNAGTPVTFTDGSTGATGWNWTFGEGAPSNTQNPTYIFTQEGSHIIRLIVNNDIPCYDTAYRIIQVDSVPFFSFRQDKHVICAGEAVNFNADYYANTARNIAWNFGDGAQWDEFGMIAHHYENAGVYWITADADFGVCGISHQTDSIVVNARPVVNLGPDNVLCLDGPALTIADLANASDPTMTWLWNTGATTSSIQVVHPGIYSVTAIKNDCATTEVVQVNKDCYTDVPNVFTPNGDGVNDYFYPRQLLSKGVVGFTMNIFNRWGQKIFESSTTNGRGWDGKFNEKEQPMGVYIYQMNVMMHNGRSEKYSGNVTLMR